MQQEFAEFRKRSVKEMDVIRQENSRLKRKVEAEGINAKGKDKETPNDLYMAHKTSLHAKSPSKILRRIVNTTSPLGQWG